MSVWPSVPRIAACSSRWLALLFGAPLAIWLAASAPLAATASVKDVGASRSAPLASGLSQQVGEPAPPFSVALLDGQPLTGADLLAQQKPFILYFFATW